MTELVRNLCRILIIGSFCGMILCQSPSRQQQRLMQQGPPIMVQGAPMMMVRQGPSSSQLQPQPMLQPQHQPLPGQQPQPAQPVSNQGQPNNLIPPQVPVQNGLPTQQLPPNVSPVEVVTGRSLFGDFFFGGAKDKFQSKLEELDLDGEEEYEKKPEKDDFKTELKKKFGKLELLKQEKLKLKLKEKGKDKEYDEDAYEGKPEKMYKEKGKDAEYDYDEKPGKKLKMKEKPYAKDDAYGAPAYGKMKPPPPPPPPKGYPPKGYPPKGYPPKGYPPPAEYDDPYEDAYDPKIKMSLKKGGYKPEGGLYNGKDYPGHYQIDMQPKGKYIPHYRNALVNETVPDQGSAQIPAPPTMTANGVVQTRGSQRSYVPPAPAPRPYPGAAAAYSPPPPPPKGRPIYPPPAAPKQQYPPPPPPEAYPGSPASPAYVPAPPQDYSSIATNYAPVQLAPPPPAYDNSYISADRAYSVDSYAVDADEYERAKMKIYPVKLVQTAPELVIDSAAYPHLPPPPSPPKAYPPPNLPHLYPPPPPPPPPPPYAGSPPPAPAYAPALSGYLPPLPPPPPIPLYQHVNYSGSVANMPVAVVNLYCAKANAKCSCTLYMTQINPNNMLISGVCSGLKMDKFYALHIYEYGDVTSGCESIGGHFNPRNATHGIINGYNSHIGDLGNIKTDSNGVAFVNKLKRDSLAVMCDKSGYNFSVLGRSLGLSDAKDDYGLGGTYDSLAHGSSGKVIACGVIGLANKENNYETRELKLREEAMARAKMSATSNTDSNDSDE